MKAYICGYGSIGKRHHRVLLELFPNIEVDIYDPNLGYYSGASGAYDVGLICTDTSNHLQVAQSIKDKCGLIFIEKPLHSSIEEIKKHQDTLSSLPVHVGCNVRYTNAIDKLVSHRDSARLVRVTAMSDLLTWRKDPNRSAYSFHKSKGGGVLVDFIHEPDYIFYAYGIPQSVVVIEKRLHNNVTVDSNDSCMMLWEYEDRTVSFALSYSSKEYIRKIELLQEDGISIHIDVTRNDIEESYKRQWMDIISNGPKNSYDDCVKLYEKILISHHA